MKQRTGFVSNSSSSSFIIAFNGDLSKEKLGDLFKTENPFLHKVSEGIVDIIIQNAQETTVDYILKDYYIKDIADLQPWLRKPIELASKKNFKIYTGSFDDGGCGVTGIEEYLCHTEIKYEDKDIIFWKEAGY